MGKKQKSPRDPDLVPDRRNDHVTTRFTKMGHAIYRLGERLMEFENDGWPDHSATDYTRDRVTGSGVGVSLTPTERAAFERMTGTVTKKAREKIRQLIDTFDLQVDKFLDESKWVTGGDVREAPDVWCASCERIEHFEPRYRGQLCRSCNDYALAHNNVWPTAQYVKAKADGVRMTKRVVEELEGQR